jgi:hypothetical protein
MDIGDRVTYNGRPGTIVQKMGIVKFGGKVETLWRFRFDDATPNYTGAQATEKWFKPIGDLS